MQAFVDKCGELEPLLHPEVCIKNSELSSLWMQEMQVDMGRLACVTVEGSVVSRLFTLMLNPGSLQTSQEATEHKRQACDPDAVRRNQHMLLLLHPFCNAS